MKPLTSEWICKMEPEYLTVRETAELLRVSPQTIRRWVEKGELPAMKIGHAIRVPKRVVLNKTPGRIEIPNEAKIRYDAMSPEEQDIYWKNLFAELDTVANAIYERHGELEDSVQVLARIRARDDEDA